MSAAANAGAPRTGRATPQYDDAGIARAAAALVAFGTIHIAYPPQQAIAGRIEVLRQRSLGRRGEPLPGLRLSQLSQAGKTRTFTEYRRQLMSRTLLATGASNPHQVLYLGLEVRVTVKMMCCQILRMLGDPHWDKGNTDEIKQRTREFMHARGVELLFVDEIQHLAKESTERTDVTDELKRFLDMGIVPVVFAGNEESRAFFERNAQLASRLGPPLELSPVDAGETAQLAAFKQFCADLDAAMVTARAIGSPSSLAEASQLNGLLVASGGHIGRVCRIVEAALEHAVLREADFIELFDLSYAVETFAIPQGYTTANPFLVANQPTAKS